jgi:hypothetical protein
MPLVMSTRFPSCVGMPTSWFSSTRKVSIMFVSCPTSDGRVPVNALAFRRKSSSMNFSMPISVTMLPRNLFECSPRPDAREVMPPICVGSVPHTVFRPRLKCARKVRRPSSVGRMDVILFSDRSNFVIDVRWPNCDGSDPLMQFDGRDTAVVTCTASTDRLSQLTPYQLCVHGCPTSQFVAVHQSANPPVFAYSVERRYASLSLAVGTGEGWPVGVVVGDADGSAVGDDVGNSVGNNVGTPVGGDDGSAVGSAVGSGDGTGVGNDDGSGVGTDDGSGVGTGDGAPVGSFEGWAVGMDVGPMHGVPMEVPVKYAEIVEDEDAHRKSSSPPSPVPERWQSPSWYVPISVGTSPQRPSLSKSRRVPLVILPSCVGTWPVSKLELKKSMFKTTSLSSFAPRAPSSVGIEPVMFMASFGPRRFDATDKIPLRRRSEPSSVGSSSEK